ncbi:PorV/PorQ family protein [Bacteroides sp.]|uniref:PorV/PorQ family protein n=1 Tax=Bacteroides sp. TaxID=29523 RepID=UPI00262E82AA|nr:PorV/PorQ family protein [Bacteroides sp.]MDD3037721.1 PorV/PorQ family protein [Bacteroides sp.]
MKRVKHFLLVFSLLPSLLVAQGVPDVTFLGLTPDAQSAGMAGTGLAITDNGSTAIFHNASTIAFSQDVMGASYSYAGINKDRALQSASLFYRIGREGKHGFTVGFRHYKASDYYVNDEKVDGISNFHPRAWSLEAGYFRSITQNLSLSLTLRYLQAKGYPTTDSKGTVCLDFGATYHRNMSILDEMASWSIGFQAANLGRKLDGQKLPARLGLGGAIDLPFSMENRLQLALDLNYLLPSHYRHLQAGVGAEYNFLKYGVIRGGYHFGDKDKGVGNYGTLGCGINFWPIRADFSYALADKDCFMYRTWQISLGVIF